jgi:tetratricopeptide (TPR) repeat protein
MIINLLLDKSGIVIKHIHSKQGLSKKICYIFGERFFNPNRLGRSEIFLSNGFDVIFIYDTRDAWYQYIDSDVIECLNKIYFTGEYQEKIAYGISMGGYAAIQFSSILRFSTVIAFSPQYSISIEADQRHYAISQEIEMRYYIDSKSINFNCSYHIISDHTQKLDWLHIDLFKKLLFPFSAYFYNVKYTGHSTAKSLSERGILKQVLIYFMRKESVSINFLKKNRRTSKTYLTYLTGALSDHKKYDLALFLLEEALLLWPNDYFLLKQKGIALRRTNKHALACEVLQLSLTSEPNNSDTCIQLSIAYEGAGDIKSAILYAKKAIELDGARSWYQRQLVRLLSKV